MSDEWSEAETSTYQDHVIAHVIGAAVLGYFVHDEALHLLLDMGFVWTVYLDGQMGLLPQGVAISELSAAAEFKVQVMQDVDALQRDCDAVGLARMSNAPVQCVITNAELLAAADRLRLIVHGEPASLIVEMSTSTGKIELGVCQSLP